MSRHASESHESCAPVKHPFFTPGVFVLLCLMGVGFVAALYRLAFGLRAATSLSDPYPWGIWIAIDVASGVALAAGGFTTAALAHVFHRREYEALVRPALLTAMLGYTFVVLGLILDLGRYYNIWHPMLPWMWQGNSVLFEVAMCVMAYLNVLYLEFAPIVCERFMGRVNLPGPLAALNGVAETVLRVADAILGRTMFLLIAAGIMLSCMHQSSLGALLLIAPYKMNPVWYTPILPLLFLLSAISVGFPMVAVESLWSSWAFKRRPETKLLGLLVRYTVVLLGVYWIAKVCDLVIREAYGAIFADPGTTIAFGIEFLIGGLIPLAMLVSARVRRTPRLLFVACASAVIGVAINRVNVFLVAYSPLYADKPYFPSLVEIAVTVGLMAGLVFVYRTIVLIFPVLPAHEPTNSPSRVAEELIAQSGERGRCVLS
ncbi:MAG TPA: Ni/Fe-hydrogenase cytochrome b subunit [Candidatus Hydrogenedentes bacterium]|nr:Ni/Fe-hydrogenase cytochrome b subunit [Candidatus Hydrogenedentota bacterium]